MTEDPRHPTEDRDDVAALLRLAGKRQTVPTERAARVKAAARAQWQDEVRGRARTRRVWVAAALATAALVVLAVTIRVVPFGTGGPAGPVHIVEALHGTARSGAGPLEIGAGLSDGAELTTAEDGGAAIRLASGHSLRLDASTRVRLLDADTLALEAGAVYVDSGVENDSPVALDVETPFGLVREIGTQFEVRLDEDALLVRLREGRVVVRRDDESHELDLGSELRMARDGSVTTHAIPMHGPDWSWIAGVTPMPDLEGQTTRAFLEWAARERGWELSFADEDVARSAGETRLGGTARRLDLEQALDAVLATSRLSHRIEDGVLTIDLID